MSTHTHAEKCSDHYNCLNFFFIHQHMEYGTQKESHEHTDRQTNCTMHNRSVLRVVYSVGGYSTGISQQ